jgi:hypothetical protein
MKKAILSLLAVCFALVTHAEETHPAPETPLVQCTIDGKVLGKYEVTRNYVRVYEVNGNLWLRAGLFDVMVQKGQNGYFNSEQGVSIVRNREGKVLFTGGTMLKAYDPETNGFEVIPLVNTPVVCTQFVL